MLELTREGSSLVQLGTHGEWEDYARVPTQSLSSFLTEWTVRFNRAKSDGSTPLFIASHKGNAVAHEAVPNEYRQWRRYPYSWPLEMDSIDPFDLVSCHPLLAAWSTAIVLPPISAMLLLSVRASSCGCRCHHAC